MRGALRGEEGQTTAKGSLPAGPEGPRPGLSLPGLRISQTATSELCLSDPQFPHWSFHCPRVRTVLRSQLGGAWLRLHPHTAGALVEGAARAEH